MALTQVGQFKLQQRGAYVARTQFKYMDDNGRWLMSAQTSNELAAQDYTIDPGDLNVPDGAIVSYYLWVMAGYDVDGQKSFTYVKGKPNTAVYKSSGVTVAPHLELVQVGTA